MKYLGLNNEIQPRVSLHYTLSLNTLTKAYSSHDLDLTEGSIMAVKGYNPDLVVCAST